MASALPTCKTNLWPGTWHIQFPIIHRDDVCMALPPVGDTRKYIHVCLFWINDFLAPLVEPSLWAETRQTATHFSCVKIPSPSFNLEKWKFHDSLTDERYSTPEARSMTTATRYSIMWHLIVASGAHLGIWVQVCYKWWKGYLSVWNATRLKNILERRWSQTRHQAWCNSKQLDRAQGQGCCFKHCHGRSLKGNEGAI